MIIAWLSRNALWIGVTLLVGVLVFVLFNCSGDDRSAQVQQTTRTTEAVASAAANAVSALENRTSDERSIDETVSSATQEIRDAKSAQAVHDAVTSTLCRRPAYRDDPACRVQ